MTLKKIVPTNKIVDIVYEKHVAHEQKALLNKTMNKNQVLSADFIHLVRCLRCFMSPIKVSKLLGISNDKVCQISNYITYRPIVCSFQKTPYKRLGKIVFEIDVVKLKEYIDNLPEEYKSLCVLSELNEERLVYKSKIRSGE